MINRINTKVQHIMQVLYSTKEMVLEFVSSVSRVEYVINLIMRTREFEVPEQFLTDLTVQLDEFLKLIETAAKSNKLVRLLITQR